MCDQSFLEPSVAPLPGSTAEIPDIFDVLAGGEDEGTVRCRKLEITQIFNSCYLVVQVSPWLPGGRRRADGVRGGLHQHGDGRAAGLADHHLVHLPELGAHNHHLDRVDGGKKSSGCETCTAERCGNSGRQ